MGFEVKETVKKKGNGEDQNEKFKRCLYGFFDGQLLVESRGIEHCGRDCSGGFNV